MTAVDLVARAVSVLAILYLLAKGSALWWILLVSVAFQVTAALVVARRALALIVPIWSLDWGLIKTLLGQASPIAFQLVLGSMIFRMDVFMLAKWQGMEAVGMYSSAVRLAESVTLLGFVISTALLPVASQVFAPDHGRFEKGARNAFTLSALLMLPICILISSYSDGIFALVYPSQYFSANTALAILIWASGLMVFNSVAATFAVAARRQWLLFQINLGTFAFTLTANWLLIPSLSFLGASLATLGTQLLGAGLYAVALARSFKHVLPSSAKRLGILGIAFTLVVSLFKSLPAPLGVILSILAYPPLMIVLECISWKDCKVLWIAARTPNPGKG